VAMVPFPPTSADFLAACSKPEAFTGNPSGNPPVAGIPTATIDQVLRREADRAAAVAFGDFATFPILYVDEGFESAVCARAARALMAYRGFDRSAGADTEIIKFAGDADKYLDGTGAGAGGKRFHPRFIDSKQNRPQDSVRVTSYRSAQDGLLHRHSPGCR